MNDTGVVKSVSWVQDEEGKLVVEAIVHFYDGHAPTITLASVWHRVPVKIIEAEAVSSGSGNG